jgi:hypothetical protein
MAHVHQDDPVNNVLVQTIQQLRNLLCTYGTQLEEHHVGVANSIEGSITLLRMARRDWKQANRPRA